jgi:hypothetical protein
MVLQAFKAETVLARQCAATLHLMLYQAYATLEHWPLFHGLLFQFVYELLSSHIDIIDLLGGHTLYVVFPHQEILSSELTVITSTLSRAWQFSTPLRRDWYRVLYWVCGIVCCIGS